MQWQKLGIGRVEAEVLPEQKTEIAKSTHYFDFFRVFRGLTVVFRFIGTLKSSQDTWCI